MSKKQSQESIDTRTNATSNGHVCSRKSLTRYPWPPVSHSQYPQWDEGGDGILAWGNPTKHNPHPTTQITCGPKLVYFEGTCFGKMALQLCRQTHQNSIKYERTVSIPSRGFGSPLMIVGPLWGCGSSIMVLDHCCGSPIMVVGSHPWRLNSHRSWLWIINHGCGSSFASLSNYCGYPSGKESAVSTET